MELTNESIKAAGGDGSTQKAVAFVYANNEQAEKAAVSETQPARAEGEGEALHPCRFVRKERGLHGSAQADHRQSQLCTGKRHPAFRRPGF